MCELECPIQKITLNPKFVRRKYKCKQPWISIQLTSFNCLQFNCLQSTIIFTSVTDNSSVRRSPATWLQQIGVDSRIAPSGLPMALNHLVYHMLDLTAPSRDVRLAFLFKAETGTLFLSIQSENDSNKDVILWRWWRLLLGLLLHEFSAIESIFC